jgi:hypothetical protein
VHDGGGPDDGARMVAESDKKTLIYEFAAVPLQKFFKRRLEPNAWPGRLPNILFRLRLV